MNENGRSSTVSVDPYPDKTLSPWNLISLWRELSPQKRLLPANHT